MILRTILTFFVSLIFLGSLSASTFADGPQKQKSKPQIKGPSQGSIEPEQQISDFSLAGYGEKGKKTWEISGKTADIFTDLVKLQQVVGNLYGEQENIKLTADKGDFNKTEGKVHLEQNVVVTTSSGSRLTTDSLNWDRKNQLVATQDEVNIVRDNIVTVGRGAVGETNLKRVSLQKDVKVDINPADETGKPGAVKDKIAIVCDGPLEVDYEKNVATFKNNVKVETRDNVIYSDIMDVYFIKSGSKDSAAPETKAKEATLFTGTKIDRIVARGNVKIVRGENVSYSDEATYLAADRKIVLTGRPRLIIYTTENLNASAGN